MTQSALTLWHWRLAWPTKLSRHFGELTSHCVHNSGAAEPTSTRVDQDKYATPSFFLLKPTPLTCLLHFQCLQARPIFLFLDCPLCYPLSLFQKFKLSRSHCRYILISVCLLIWTRSKQMVVLDRWRSHLDIRVYHKNRWINPYFMLWGWRTGIISRFRIDWSKQSSYPSGLGRLIRGKVCGLWSRTGRVYMIPEMVHK